ncbi:MAG: tetratricopeptide repeat protein [Holophagales bacterium]|nr:tetratricopeptide repeat protein [Holophagales bacterium]
MNATLDRALLDEVSGFIAERMGLHFPEERWPDLARGLKTAGEELGFESPDACVRWLRTRKLTTRQIETLASHLTVGETYFFRDPASFEALEREILPPLVAKRSREGRTFRFWSAGCCTGEEAYSLAITCARALPDLKSWNVSILATDINPKFLAKAEAGVYGAWSFRGVPGGLRERFFSPVSDKNLAIAPAVRKLVRFGYLNLAEDAYPSLHNHTNVMDVIFCRNVLMYLTPDHQRRVVAALHRCLVDGGWLVVSPAEGNDLLFPMFSAESIGGVLLYRRNPPATRVASRPEPSPSAPARAGPPSGPARTGAPTLPRPPTFASPGANPLTLARTQANQGRLEEALAACRNALAAERTNPTAYFLYATICDELGRTEEAIEALGKVLYLDQDFILAHHALGGLYRQVGRKKESVRHIAIALELLSARSPEELVPESDGMTCGRLAESVGAMTGA